MKIIKQNNTSVVVGLDIGTSKVVAIVGEFDEAGGLHIRGIGSQPSRGLKRGVVVNIDSTVQSIQRAVSDAETMAGVPITSAYTGIAGSHIRSLNSHGVVAIRDQEVTPDDITRVMEAAKAVPIPADQKILHILPQEFMIDHQGGIREPVGMAGIRLETKVHLVTGAVGAAQNIIKCVKRCGLAVNDIILEQLAASFAVLNDDEKELGVCLVDIGGGTSDIAIFTEGAIRHTAVVPVAGDQVTGDIAVALRIPTQCAEGIKLEYGCALESLADASEVIPVPTGVNRHDKRVSQRMLARVMEARYEEVMNLVKAQIDSQGLSGKLNAGIVLTGGASKVPHLVALAERVFGIPCRLGHPGRRVVGDHDLISNPSYATSIGLLLYGWQEQQDLRVALPASESVRGTWAKIKQWVQGNF